MTAPEFHRAGVFRAVFRTRMFVKPQLEECSACGEWHGRSHKVQVWIEKGLKGKGKLNNWSWSGVKVHCLQPWQRVKSGHTKAQKQDPCLLSPYVYNRVIYIWVNHCCILVESMPRNTWQISKVFQMMCITTFSCAYFSCWCCEV